MTKRIIAIMIVTLMLISIIPLQAFATDEDPITLELGYGAWTGSDFEGGYFEAPRIGAEVKAPWTTYAGTENLNMACIDEKKDAENQDYGYQIADASWSTGTTVDENGKTVFGWTDDAKLTFSLYVPAGWTVPCDGYTENESKLLSDKITLHYNGSELGGYKVTGTYKKVVSGSHLWNVTITFEKRAVIYGNSEASFVVDGEPLENCKVGDAFPTDYEITGIKKDFYTVDINWYYAIGEMRNYTRGEKVSDTVIQPDVGYLCELTFKLKDDAPTTVHRIDANGSAECVLYNTDTNKNIPGYFSWNQVAGVNDNPDEKTLTVRRYVSYQNIVKDVEIKGIKAPAVGAKPVDYGITFAAPFDNWAVKSAKWSGSFEEEGVFLAGEKYYLEIVIEGGGDLRELNAANAQPIPQGYTLAQANAGDVVSFENVEEIGLTIKIEFIAGPEDYHTYTIDMSEGKTEIDVTDKALLATLEAMKEAGDFSYQSITSLEENIDLDIDGTWDVVVQNGILYQPYEGNSIKGSYTVELSKNGYKVIKTGKETAYYSAIKFIFTNDSDVTETLKGDINGDGFVDNKDVVLLFRYVSGGGTYDAKYDFNDDTNIDNKDVVALFRYVSSLTK